jgi:hypothetical protein
MTKPQRPPQGSHAPAARPPSAGRATGILATLGALLLGCSSDPPVLSVEIITGYEQDTFSQEPPVTSVNITARAAEGDLTLSASAAPGGSFDFGDVPSDRLLTFEATGVDAAGAVVVRGRSIGGIYLAGVSGGVIPVFVQRVNQWARPPGGLARSHVGAPAAVLAERYLMTTGGASASSETGPVEPAASDFYDLFAYGGAVGPVMPRGARSMVARTSAVLLVDDGGASWVDFDTGTYEDMALPAGLGSFAEVAGGQTIESSDGRSFIVGATRRGGAKTNAVLEVKVDGSLGVVSLGHARAGAAAVWLEGAGLVVAGGSAEGPGVEVLAPGATGFNVLDFPADAAEGAGAVVVDTARIGLVGGVSPGAPDAPAPTRLIAPGCSQMCAAEELPQATPPVALAGVTAFSLGGGRAVVTGNELVGAGLMRAFVIGLAAPSVDEAPLREPRSGASVVAAPNGTLAILGGSLEDGSPALTVEMLFPK